MGLMSPALLLRPSEGKKCAPRWGSRRGAATFIWLAVGRLAPAKDYPNMLLAFAAAVRAEKSDAQLWVAGDARGDETNGTRDSSRKISQIDAAVRWLGLRRDMPALFDAADAFVSSSAWEGMPLAVGEAMSMAKPVVVTDVGGVRELVGDAGAVVPAKNSRALANAMLETMQQSRESLACKWPGSARTHPAQLQHGRNRRDVGGAIRIVDREPK